MTPHAIFAMQLKLSTLMIETQTVMALRMMAMGGLIPAEPGENARMVSEKGPAMTKAFVNATEAMMRGQGPAGIMSAAMAPVSRKVSANRKRLTK